MRILAVSVVPFLVACGPSSKVEVDPPRPTLLDEASIQVDDLGDPQVRLEDLKGIHLVEHYEGPWIVLGASADESWASGNPEAEAFAENGAVDIASVRIAPAALPAAYRGVRGRKVVLHGLEGPTCSGALETPRLLYRAPPYDLPDDSDAEAATRFGPPIVAARLSVPGGDCTGARWAMPVDSPPPASYLPVPAPASMEDARATLLEAFRALPEYVAVQQDYQRVPEWLEGSEEHLPRHWDEYGGASSAIVWYSNSEDDDSIVGVHASVGAGCGDFSRDLVALFQFSGGHAEPRMVFGGDLPEEILDVDGDGRWEVLRGPSLGLETILGPAFAEVPAGYFVCPC